MWRGACGNLFVHSRDFRTATIAVHCTQSFISKYFQIFIRMETTSPAENDRISQEQESCSEPLQPHNASSWTPGIWRNIPWTSFLALVGVLLSIMSIAIKANGDPTENWPIQPSVYFALASAASNILIHFAFQQSIVIVWWVKSLRNGTHIADLHQIWAQATSLK